MKRNRAPRRIWPALLLATLAFAFGASPLPSVALATGRGDRWFALLLQGQPIGWMHSVVTEDGSVIESEIATYFELRRGPLNVTARVTMGFRETSDGKPIENWVMQDLGLIKSNQTMRYKKDSIELITEQAGMTRRRTIPHPEQSWLTPAAQIRYIEKQIASGATEIRFWAVDPMNGVAPYQTHWKLITRENVEVQGKVIPGIVWNVTLSNMPQLASRLYTDERGKDIKTTLNLMPGMPFEMVLSDEQFAKAKVNPPDLVASTLVRPDRIIINPRQLRSASYKLDFTHMSDLPPPDAAGGKPSPFFELPETGVQRVIWHGHRAATVHVSLDSPIPPGDDRATDVHLRASAMLNHEDPEVRRLLKQALDTTAASEPERAEQLRAFVHDFIDVKDLSVGFATASEVARTRQGDCSEHGVLLATMLRGANIPSRTVGGVIYVASEFLGQSHTFGYHMWTQAWLPVEYENGTHGHGWVDLDATRSNPYDAAHIALAVGAMDDNSAFNELFRMAPMIGRLSIRVVETSP